MVKIKQLNRYFSVEKFIIILVTVVWITPAAGI